MIRAALASHALPADDDQRRFAFYCDEWLVIQQKKVKESTYVNYYRIIENHLKPGLGNILPSDMSELIVHQFTHQLMTVKMLSAKTVKDILVLLRSILNFTARQVGVTFSDIQIEYPKNDPGEIRVLSREEQTRFVSFLLTDMDECRFGVYLALMTGMRIGEICALRWEDISLADRMISVRSTMQRIKNLDGTSKTKVVIGSPKSAKSMRTIPLTDTVAALCTQICPDNHTAYLLTGTNDYMEPRRLQYQMAKYAAACNLEGVHFHTLRHSFATRCVEVGFEIKCLSEILGHASTSVTLERYVHSSLELKRKNMQKLSDVGMG